MQRFSLGLDIGSISVNTVLVDLERNVVTLIHNALLRRLDELRLPKEIWITESN